MPFLGFSVLPPASSVDAGAGGGRTRESESSLQLSLDRSPSTEAISTCKHPTVRLDLDVLKDEVAARLAMSLLGHVLFLKSQVPFPVAQLSRIPGANSTIRSAKQRNDLLQSFDTLGSHLMTTFTALSTALARCASSLDESKSDTKQPSGLTMRLKDRERVFLALLVGPSIGSARAKVILGVDGLETKVWGMRDDVKARTDVDDYDSEEVEKEGEGEAVEEQEEENDSEDEEDESEEASDSSHSEEDSDEEDSNGGSSPPQSRSPTPEPEPSSPPSYITHAEQQRVLHLAERLLARTLATADAEGNSMAAEMAPTHTHILLRAPRRFEHPAWIPRQNISMSMENTLDDFLIDSGLLRKDITAEKKRKGQKGRVEGVWITCRDGFGEVNGNECKMSSDENDEMIWWSWDGTLTGFSEW